MSGTADDVTGRRAVWCFDGQLVSQHRRGRPSLLVADDARINRRGLAARNRRKTGQASVIVFILVPQVALKKRLDVESAAKRQAARVPSLIARHWPQS